MSAPEKYYDLSSLKNMLDNDEEALKKMLAITLESSPTILSGLLESLKNNDIEKIGFFAHKLKSTIDILNIAELKTDIRTIEKSAKEQTALDQIPTLVEKTNQILQSVFEGVEKDLANL